MWELNVSIENVIMFQLSYKTFNFCISFSFCISFTCGFTINNIFFIFYHLHLTTFTSYEKSCFAKLILISMKKMLIVFLLENVSLFFWKTCLNSLKKCYLLFLEKLTVFFIKNNTYIFMGKYDLKISHVNFLLKTCCFLFLFLNIFLIYLKTWSPLYWEMHNFLDACHIFIIYLFLRYV